MFIRLATGVAAAALLAACGAETASTGKMSAEIRRTAFGVPHVKADDYAGMGFGLEVDVYRSQSNVKAQTPPRQGTNLLLSGPIPGSDFLVHSLAFNALVRVTGYQYKVEPYAGLGLGLNLGNISDGNFRPEASFAPSFNVLAGIKYYLTAKVAPFIEYKYNFAHFSFDRTNVTADYRANLFMFGVAYHFDR